MKTNHYSKQQGASVVHWLIALLALLGFAVLAIDLNNLYLAKSDLQNAADAGALEGARTLYTADAEINTACTVNAENAAKANSSQGAAVSEVNANRGHWEFRNDLIDVNGIVRGGTFSANASTTPVDLLNPDGSYKTFQELNSDLNEINAVEVTASHQLTPVQAFFGPILGINDYQVQARAVAYVGFAGTIEPFVLDFPMAICEHRLRNETGDYSCTVGRLISSNETDTSGQTAGWTNFEQPDQCTGGASSSEISSMFSCGNPLNPELLLGKEMEVIGGEVQNVFDAINSCWLSLSELNANPIDTSSCTLKKEPDEQPDQPWSVTLPIIQCSDSNPGPCNQLMGAVSLDILWINRSVANVPGDTLDAEAPWQMADWDAHTAADITDVCDGVQRWNSFVNHFQIKSGPGGELATFENGGYGDNTLYFSPSCEPHTPVGGTGGANFGIRAATPVLVY
jgi:hypothetical protein